MFFGNTNIRKPLSALMLIIFSIAITPRLYFHQLFANHTDHVGTVTAHGKTVLSVGGYNCQCDDQVAESTFLANLPQIEVILPLACPSTSILKIRFSSLPAYYTALRGPPQLVG